MDQAWRAELRDALAAEGLPRGYVERYLAELTDHWNDLKEENQTMSTQTMNPGVESSRLGTAETLTAAAVGQHRGFAGRHPILTFVVAPIPAALVGFVVYVLLVVTAVHFFEGETTSTAPLAMKVFAGVFASLSCLPFALLAWWLCRLAVRNGRSWRWAVTACFLIAILAGSVAVSYQLPEAAGQGQLAIGLGLGPNSFHFWQALLPLGICGIYLLLTSRRQTPPATG